MLHDDYVCPFEESRGVHFRVAIVTGCPRLRQGFVCERSRNLEQG
jgi:hypothetical protein